MPGHSHIGVCTAVVLVFLGWSIYWQSMKNPYLPEFEMESAFVSQLNTNSSSLTATWNISLLARNPNPSKLNRKYKIYFDNVPVEVRYNYIGDQVFIRLGSTQLPPFDLIVKEDKRLNFKVEAEAEWIADAVAQQISKDMSRGSVRFGVRLPIAVRFKGTLLPSDSAVLEIVWHELDFKFPWNNGTGVLTGASQPEYSVQSVD